MVKAFFLAIQFKCQTVQFDTEIEPCQVQLLRVRLDQGAIAMKGYTTFLKAPRLEPRHQIVCVISGHSLGESSYRSEEMQPVYSRAPADSAVENEIVNS